jgi:hypothetical protein
MSLTYPRYDARDFERRWQTRLNTPLRRTTNSASALHVEVTHRFPAPNRYGWELRPAAGLSAEESRVQFASWEEASQAGKLALNQFLQRQLDPAHARTSRLTSSVVEISGVRPL